MVMLLELSQATGPYKTLLKPNLGYEVSSKDWVESILLPWKPRPINLFLTPL